MFTKDNSKDFDPWRLLAVGYGASCGYKIMKNDATIIVRKMEMDFFNYHHH